MEYRNINEQLQEILGLLREINKKLKNDNISVVMPNVRGMRVHPMSVKVR